MNRLVGSWVGGMQRLHASPSWTALWLGLLARTAKDDWKGGRLVACVRGDICVRVAVGAVGICILGAGRCVMCERVHSCIL